MTKNQRPHGSGEKQSPVGGRVHGCSSELSFATVSDVSPWSWRGEKRTPMVRVQPQIFSSPSAGDSAALQEQREDLYSSVKNHNCNKNNRTKGAITLAANANAHHSAPTLQPSLLRPLGDTNKRGNITNDGNMALGPIRLRRRHNVHNMTHIN